MFAGFVGLLMGAMAMGPVEHRVRVDHHTGSVDAQYRADVRIDHRQIGSVGAGGRPSTLRCLWTAGLVVDRHATHASGSTLRRTFVQDDVASGSRPGWCSAQRAGIAREVAAKADAMRDHLVRVAQADHAVLHAEVDRMHGTARAG